MIQWLLQEKKKKSCANNKTINQKGRGKQNATSTRCLRSTKMQNEGTITTEVTSMPRSESVHQQA